MSCPTKGHETRIAPCYRTLASLRFAPVGAKQAPLAPSALKHLKSAHFSAKNGSFSVLCATQSHKFSCKHEIYDLLSLVSYNH